MKVIKRCGLRAMPLFAGCRQYDDTESGVYRAVDDFVYGNFLCK